MKKKTNFNDFLMLLENKKKKDEPVNQSNLKSRIDYFKSLVASFYDKLENEWLGEYKDRIIIDSGNCLITEETLGNYEVTTKTLHLGDESVQFIPVGTVLIGTDARIDLHYKRKTVMFVHIGDKINRARDLITISIDGEKPKKRIEPGEKVWKFTFRDSRLDYITATAETVQELLMSLINEEDKVSFR